MYGQSMVLFDKPVLNENINWCQLLYIHIMMLYLNDVKYILLGSFLNRIYLLCFVNHFYLLFFINFITLYPVAILLHIVFLLIKITYYKFFFCSYYWFLFIIKSKYALSQHNSNYVCIYTQEYRYFSHSSIIKHISLPRY